MMTGAGLRGQGPCRSVDRGQKRPLRLSRRARRRAHSRAIASKTKTTGECLALVQRCFADRLVFRRRGSRAPSTGGGSADASCTGPQGAHRFHSSSSLTLVTSVMPCGRRSHFGHRDRRHHPRNLNDASPAGSKSWTPAVGSRTRPPSRPRPNRRRGLVPRCWWSSSRLPCIGAEQSAAGD